MLIVDSHVIAGNIIAKLGVKYLYIISFGVMTPFLIAIYFLVWETTYTRPPPPEMRFMMEKNDTDDSSSPSSSSTKDGSLDHDLPSDIKKDNAIETIEDTRDTSPQPP